MCVCVYVQCYVQYIPVCGSVIDLMNAAFQELLSEALQEERERSEAAIQRTVESTREQVQTKMEDTIKVNKTLRFSEGF